MNDDPSKAASKAAPISAVIPMKATLLAARKSAMKAAPGTRAVRKAAPVTGAGRKKPSILILIIYGADELY